jgi:GT2 family glycosyltransferase
MKEEKLHAVNDSESRRLSIVLGTLNRLRLLQATMNNIRAEISPEEREIIVVDGGSSDGTIDWLKAQSDIRTIAQPNVWIDRPNAPPRLRHSWGCFINEAFRRAAGKWVLMVSDDLLLCRGSVTRSLAALTKKESEGFKIGGGALYWRDFPSDSNYRVNMLPGGFVNVNHGFYRRAALEEIGFADESAFNFYGADGDLSMRLNLGGWRTVALSNCYAEHMNHRIRLRARPTSRDRAHALDMQRFYARYSQFGESPAPTYVEWSDPDKVAQAFWRLDTIGCMQGLLRRLVRKQRRLFATQRRILNKN